MGPFLLKAISMTFIFFYFFLFFLHFLHFIFNLPNFVFLNENIVEFILC